VNGCPPCVGLELDQLDRIVTPRTVTNVLRTGQVVSWSAMAALALSIAGVDPVRASNAPPRLVVRGRRDGERVYPSHVDYLHLCIHVELVPYVEGDLPSVGHLTVNLRDCGSTCALVRRERLPTLREARA
jgi:hypothetical protein